MRKEDKAFLRWVIRRHPTRLDWEMARDADCTVQTVRRYRKALAPEARKEPPC